MSLTQQIISHSVYKTILISSWLLSWMFCPTKATYREQSNYTAFMNTTLWPYPYFICTKCESFVIQRGALSSVIWLYWWMSSCQTRSTLRAQHSTGLSSRSWNNIVRRETAELPPQTSATNVANCYLCHVPLGWYQQGQKQEENYYSSIYIHIDCFSLQKDKCMSVKIFLFYRILHCTAWHWQILIFWNVNWIMHYT